MNNPTEGSKTCIRETLKPRNVRGISYFGIPISVFQVFR
jgi:hypothetical protein